MTDAAQALTANQEAGIRERLAAAFQHDTHWDAAFYDTPEENTANLVFLMASYKDVAALLGEIDRLRQREIDLCTALDVEGACPDDCIGKVRR